MLNGAVDACKASIEGDKGRMVVKEAARAVSEKEERALEEELQVEGGGGGGGGGPGCAANSTRDLVCRS